MTQVHQDTQALHIAALSKIIANDEAFGRLIADNDKIDEIYASKPYLVGMLEDALTKRDEQRFHEEEQEEDFLSGFVPQDDDSDDDSDDEPERGNFGLRMAKLRKDRAEGKAEAKPTKTRKPKAEKTYTHRVKNYKSGTVGNIVRGKEKRPSVHTTAFERLSDSGEVIDRVMLGTTQAEVVRAAVLSE